MAAGGGKAGSNIHYIKQGVPSFLRDFKAQVGYKEGPTVETKRQKQTDNDRKDIIGNYDDANERDDEKPVVCVLRTGDLTEEEAEHVSAEIKQEEEESAISEGKIQFKKPCKKDDGGNLSNKTISSSNKRKTDENKRTKAKKIKNPTLLSFGNDDEEDS